MDILIPDTMNGALLLSIIDFFLSFVVISFIGFVLAMLPLLNRLGPGIAAKIQHQLPPASARVDMTGDDHIAAISAAVAVIGAHRIAHVEPAHHGAGWLGGRPRRSPQLSRCWASQLTRRRTSWLPIAIALAPTGRTGPGRTPCNANSR